MKPGKTRRLFKLAAAHATVLTLLLALSGVVVIPWAELHDTFTKNAIYTFGRWPIFFAFFIVALSLWEDWAEERRAEEEKRGRDE